eukprot:scaffold2252_cov171-Ochromonas_danica.AAC.2
MQQCRDVGTVTSREDLQKHLGKVNGVPQCIPRDGTHVHYKVHEVNTKVRPSTMVLGTNEKGKQLTVRNATFAEKCAKKRQKIQAEEAKRQQKRESCAAFFCPDLTCSAAFLKQ